MVTTIELKKITFLILCGALVLCFVLSIISIGISIKNISHGDQLEKKLNSAGITSESLNVVNDNYTNLVSKIDSMSSDFKTIKSSVDELEQKNDKNKNDIFYIQTSILGKDLKAKMDALSEKIDDLDNDINGIKEIQKIQQTKLDEYSNSYTEFTENIIDKITLILSSKNTPTKQTSQTIKNVPAFNNFVLNSIEYRSGELWAVFYPKSKGEMSELKFVTLGEMIDGWVILEIDEKSVTIEKNSKKQRITL